MLDDLVCISECGPKTAMANAYINFKTAAKKLQFGTEKCKNMHIGKVRDQYKCEPLFVDHWEEKIVEDCDTTELKIEDVFEGEKVMEEKESERYLGDVISRDVRNLKNFQARVNRGTGIVKKILTMLDGIYFGKFYFEAAVILRNSLLVSSVCFNSEAWYNITEAEITLLETVDLQLLRGILKAPKSTPKEMLFLELGVVPFKEIVRKKRLIFLHYILQQKEDSLIAKVFESKVKNPKSRNWVTTVRKDLLELNLNMKFDDIKIMKKITYMNIIKRKIENKALKELEKVKQKHTKVMHLAHPVLKMQKYLSPNESNMKQEDSQLIFKLRSQVTETKINMKGLYDTHECRACGYESENQKHIYECKILLKNNEEYEENKYPNYEELFSKNVKDQLLIAKLFSKNMKILDEIIKNK